MNDLHYETKFENRVKDKNNSFIKRNSAFLKKSRYILFLETYFFKIPKNSIVSAFFFADSRKHRYASPKASNAALVKLTD